MSTLESLPFPSEPEVTDYGKIIVPEIDVSDEGYWRDWCEAVNYLYADKGYHTSIRAWQYRIAKLTLNMNGNRTYNEIQLPPSGPHYFFGRFKDAIMSPPIRSLMPGDFQLIYMPFVRLEFAEDVISGKELGTQAEQYFMAPLSVGLELAMDRSVSIQG